MPEPIHPDDLIDRLLRDKWRCFVVTGRPGEGKTRLAEQMAAHYNGQRLDLLSTFASDPSLASTVNTFTPRRCKEFLRDYAHGDLVLIDELEFLWHRWDPAEKKEFLNILKMWGKSAFFGVFLPPDQVIERFDMPDQDGRTRIISLHDLQAI